MPKASWDIRCHHIIIRLYTLCCGPLFVIRLGRLDCKADHIQSRGYGIASSSGLTCLVFYKPLDITMSISSSRSLCAFIQMADTFCIPITALVVMVSG
ncbi:hypothetical protein NOF04DRAFT_1327806 [Fusarium oxysporum II5]|nr:hypothetical protein NOF04DRAFT_1327806 [Fusarium oxysporum II5]